MIRVDPATVAPACTPVERRLALLARLAEIGMEIAEEAGRQATGRAAEGPPMADPALAYVRVARAVRMSVALQSRLAEDLAALERAQDAGRAERRRRLDRLVERAVEAEHAEGDETGPLRWEARERLADAEIDAEIDGLDFAEVVARICGDLGLSPERTARIVAAADTDDRRPAATSPNRGWAEAPSGRGPPRSGAAAGPRAPPPP